MLYSPAFTPLFHGAASALDEILLFCMLLAVSNSQFELDAPAGLPNPAAKATDLAIRREHICQNENCCVLLSYPALLNVPFYLAGGLKIVYDVLLYRSFRTLKPLEEKADGG